MFSFSIKNNNSETEMYMTRALLAIAAVAAFAYAGELNYYAGMTLGFILVIASVYVKTILERFKINRTLFLCIAGILTFITSGSFAIVLVFLVHGAMIFFLHKRTTAEVDAGAVTVKGIFYDRTYTWAALSNVVLKDGILTLDFHSNKIIQLEIKEDGTSTDEKQFNEFCKKRLSMPGSNGIPL